MKAVLDENLPTAFAVALNALSKHDDDEVCHVTDLAPRGTADVELFEVISAAGIQVHVTQDHHDRRQIERDAIAARGLVVFVLSKAWSTQGFWAKATQLVRWWPAIREQAMRNKPPAVFRVPWKFSGKGKFEQIRLK